MGDPQARGPEGGPESDPQALARLRGCEGFLLDLDGTLYVDHVPVPGAGELLGLLRERGIPHLFLTNNSSARAEDYRLRLREIGIEAWPGQVLTSGTATIHHLHHHTPHRSAYVVGTPALEQEFRDGGIELDEADPDCVVVGFDTTLTYAKLERACALLFAGKPYYATHPDRTCITARGRIPDIAAIIAGLEAVTGRTPEVIGKPGPGIVQAALERLGSRAAATAMVGDQLDTDMTMARRSGLCGVLVLSGETSRERLEACPREQRPTLVATSVAQVAQWLG